MFKKYYLFIYLFLMSLQVDCCEQYEFLYKCIADYIRMKGIEEEWSENNAGMVYTFDNDYYGDEDADVVYVNN